MKIHFIHCIDTNNLGDMVCCPLEYYYDFFKDYNYTKHHISFIRLSEISKNDIIILGGGGLINHCSDWNDDINKLFDFCDNVICWGVGFNSHIGSKEKIQEINFNRFKLVSIRDFNHPSKLPFVPCVSCKSSKLDVSPDIKRDIGIISNIYFSVGNLPYETFGKNNHSFIDTVNFINTSKNIITSSYHVAYWSGLLGKPVLLSNVFSDKFNFLLTSPKTFSGDVKDFNNFVNIPNALNYARELNDDFFIKVKDIINKVDDKKDFIKTDITVLDRLADLEYNCMYIKKNTIDKPKKRLFSRIFRKNIK